MDSDTRFLLARQIHKQREAKHACNQIRVEQKLKYSMRSKLIDAIADLHIKVFLFSLQIFLKILIDACWTPNHD